MAPFCSCPASLVSRICFAVGPGCAKCFLLLRSVGRRDLSAGPEPKKKKNTTQGVFFCSGPGKGRGRRSPVPARGQSKKKKHHPGCVFCCGPGERQGKEKTRWAPARGQSKKKHHPGCFFFCSGPGERQGKEKPRSGPVPAPNGASPSPAFPRGRSQKTKHPGWFFFCSAPVPAPNGSSPSLAFRRGRSKKKHTLGGVFFLLWPRAGTGLLLPLPFSGAGAKKTHPGWCFFFFCCGPARTLTHSVRAWVAMPPPRRGVFFFLLRPRPDRGVFFFFLLWPRPDAHSLTVGWGDFGKARVVFFLLRPRRVFLDNSKKCLGYYIGSKKTRRGHSKKKNTTSRREPS